MLAEALNLRRYMLSVLCHRVSQLETELKQVRQKESEDTTALEKIIQQVETRLQATTVCRGLYYLRGLFDNSAESHTSVYAALLISLLFERPSSHMKISTNILDNLCRMEKKTTMLGGGGHII